VAYIPANDDQRNAVQVEATAQAAPAVNVMTPPEGDSTPQTHAFASLTG
jgi:hypothetical protein